MAGALLEAGANAAAAMTGSNTVIGVGPGSTAVSIADKHKQAKVAQTLRDMAK